VLHPGAGDLLQQAGREMRPAARTIGCIVQLAGARLEMRDQIADGIYRQRRIDHQDAGRIRDQGDRREIALRVERELAVERRIGGKRDAGEQQRVAVGRRVRDRGGADIGRGPGAIDHHEALAQAVAQPLGEHARDQVGAAAGCERHHDLDQARRIGLCGCRRDQ
jgi:hypothetical protein